MANYSEEDYSRLKFRVDKVDVNAYVPTSSFPEINFYPELSHPELIKELVDKNIYGKIFAYICYVYDYNSPMVKFSDNVIKLKTDAMTASGIQKNKIGNFDTYIENIMLNKNIVVNRMIMMFLRLLKNADWVTLVTYRETLYRQLGELRDSTADKDGDTIKNTQILREEISKIEVSFLTFDNTEDMRLALYDKIENDNLVLRPEHIAMITMMHEEPDLYNPYIDGNKSVKEFIFEHAELVEKEAKQVITKKKYKNYK